MQSIIINKTNACHQNSEAMNAARQTRFWTKLVFQLLVPAFVLTQNAKAELGTATTASIQQPVPQATIKGKIIDYLTGNPITEAIIQIKGNSTGSVSKWNGNFSLYNPTNAKQVTLVINIATEYGFSYQELIVSDYNTPITILYSQEPEQTQVIASLPSRPAQKQLIYSSAPLPITDTLIDNNNVSIYPIPVASGDPLFMDIKKVEKDNYHLQLLTTEGAWVQAETVTVLAKDFNYQWLIDEQVAAGKYIIRVLNSNGKQIYRSNIIIH